MNQDKPTIRALIEAKDYQIAEQSSLIHELAEWVEHDGDCILRSYHAGRPTSDGGYEMLYGYGKDEKWYRETPECTCQLGPVLTKFNQWKESQT